MSLQNSNVIALLSVLLINNVHAAAGDEWVITKPIVNLREGPSTETEILIKLQQGTKLIEIQRESGWLEVNTGRADVETAWIYQPLVKKVAQKAAVINKRFERFKQRFDIQNEVLQKQKGVAYFSKVIDKGEGTVDLIVTQAWLDERREVRERTVNELFLLWGAIAEVGKTISMQVVDEQGTQHMVMVR